MNVNDMTIGELKSLLSIVNGGSTETPYTPGTCWIWRSVTHYNIGIVKKVMGDVIVLEPGASWVADTGRYGRCLEEGWDIVNEVEVYGNRTAVVHLGAVVDAQQWDHGLAPKSK